MAERPEGEASATRLIGSALAPVLRQPVARIIANAETIRYAGSTGNLALSGLITFMVLPIGPLSVTTPSTVAQTVCISSPL